MSVQFRPYEGMPTDLNNFRTLVEQYRGFHWNYLNGMALEVPLIGFLFGWPYCTGWTWRMFGWIGDTSGRFEMILSSVVPVDPDHLSTRSIGIIIEGTKVSFFDYYHIEKQRILRSRFSLQLPGYFSLALRLDLPSSIQFIFGQDQEIYRAQNPTFADRLLKFAVYTDGDAKHLSMHMSDEQRKSSSNVVLKAEDVIWLKNIKNLFVVIECHIVDITQPVLVKCIQNDGEYTQTSFLPSGLEKNDEVLISVRDTKDGLLIGTSFSPELRFLKAEPRSFMMFPELSENCQVLRMRWEWYI